jgi:hypothetical protein
MWMVYDGAICHSRFPEKMLLSLGKNVGATAISTF